jgi:hypothetical protein
LQNWHFPLYFNWRRQEPEIIEVFEPSANIFLQTALRTILNPASPGTVALGRDRKGRFFQVVGLIKAALENPFQTHRKDLTPSEVVEPRAALARDFRNGRVTILGKLWTEFPKWSN